MPTDNLHQQRRRKPSATSSSSSSSSSSSAHPFSKKSRSGSAHSSSSTGSHSSAHSHVSSSVAAKRARTRFSVPEDAQGLSKFASLTGFLRKQADNEQGAWNTYYFALRPATLLYYYNTPTDDRPRGVIDMEFLQDIRFNVDCLQRCIGGSEHCFRVSGQMPKDASSHSSSSSKLKLRPLFLDPENSIEAREWMAALKKHRFNAEHAEGYETMAHRVHDTECSLQQLSDRAQRTASAAERIRRRGRALLNALRGLEPEDDSSAGRGSFDVDSRAEDVLATLEAVESLVEDLNAEAEQQAKVIATLRAREAQQEQRLRELSKLASLTTAAGTDDPSSSSASIISADELSRLDKAGATKARSTSDVRELFKLTTTFLSKKPADSAAAAATTATSSPKLTPCAEADDEDSNDADVPTGSVMTGLVDALKKRVNRSATTVTAPVVLGGTPTSRESDDTVSITTDDCESVECSEERLPRGWTKRESRSHAGEYYYAHTSGFTCWEIPTDFVDDDGELVELEPDEPLRSAAAAVSVEPTGSTSSTSSALADKPLSSLADVVIAATASVSAADTSSASPDESKTAAVAKKPSKGWGFLRKFPLAKASATAAATSPKQDPLPVVAVEHPDGRHEF